jgi:hypothetical protein
MTFFAFSDKKDYRDRGIKMIKELCWMIPLQTTRFAFIFEKQKHYRIQKAKARV